ncbi:MAG: hypothetical protein M5U33_00400 [Pseudorhodoplanes sp.]|nr:hypothetical protein [Pseudorhodoplanes sp.]
MSAPAGAGGTRSGRALYLTSLHRIRPDDVERVRRRAARQLLGE